ncbi:MAG: hypothetical protein FWD87_00455 [Spirochaetaceae bacterium]|nr:hypothetical protein [Spirochaetaceae bacterium]
MVANELKSIYKKTIVYYQSYTLAITGKGDMFYTDTEKEIEEIISLYKRLNPFFKEFMLRQLRDLIEYK